MSNQILFGYMTIVLGLAAGVPYVISILRGKTRPHIFTYALWLIMTSIAAAGQLADHGGPGAWSCMTAAFFCLINVILSFKHGEKSITKSDWICLVIGLAAIPLWYVTSNPLPAVFLATLIIAAAYIPTFRKTYLKPHEELVTSYFIGNIRHICSVLAMTNWSFTTLFTPGVLFLINAALIGMVLWRRHAK